MPNYGEIQAMVKAISPSGGPAVAVSPSASPYTYLAGSNGRLIVSGGTVTTIELGRNGSFTLVGLLAGVIPMSVADQVRVTYVVAPTMTFLPT